MNPKCTLVGIGLALLTFTSNLRADAAGYAAILKEREAVLSKIVAEAESRYSSGTADGEAVSSAKLALYSFRRDAASTSGEKARHQKEIVALQEARLGSLKAHSKAGLGSSLDVLRATDDVLAAKQMVEEFQLNEKKG